MVDPRTATAPPAPPVREDSRGTYYWADDVYALSASQYEAFVYSVKTVKVDEVRVHAHPLINGILTKSPPFLPLFVWLPLIWYFAQPCISYAVGFLLWFIIEPLFHKYIFHMPITEYTKKTHFLLHGIHHVAPSDLWHVFSPPHECAVQLSVIYLILRVGTTLAIGSAESHATSLQACCGILTNYLRYDIMHYLIHHPTVKLSAVPVVGAFLTQCRKGHMRHHFVDPINSTYRISF